MAALCCLTHAFKTSDEATVRRWLENPYHQYFCGQEYFCHKLPIDPSSLSRFRKRINEKGSELILQVTVQEKAVAYPTDARLFNRSRQRLVRLARKHGVRLQQSYSRPGRLALMWVDRYFHACQAKRAQREIKPFEGFSGSGVSVHCPENQGSSQTAGCVFVGACPGRAFAVPTAAGQEQTLQPCTRPMWHAPAQARRTRSSSLESR